MFVWRLRSILNDVFVSLYRQQEGADQSIALMSPKLVNIITILI